MFVSLPIEFQIPGRVNLGAVERYWKDDLSHQSKRPYQITIRLVSNTSLIANFAEESRRDEVFSLMDRYFTGKDKAPQYDAEDW